MLAYSQDDKIELDEGKLDSHQQRDPADDRRGPDQGRISPTPRTGCGRANSSMPGCCWRRGTTALTVPAGAVQQGQDGMLRLCDQARQHGGEAHHHGRADQQRAGADRLAGSPPTNRSSSTASTSCSPAATSPSCTARRPRRPQRRTPSKSQSHEHFRAVHRAADRDRALDGGPAAAAALPPIRCCRSASLPNVNYPTISVTAQLPGADPADHGVVGGDAAGGAVRPDPRHHPDDLVERARLHLDHAAIRPQPRHRGRGRPIRWPRSTPPAASCRRP